MMFEKEFVGITDWKKQKIHEGDIMKWPKDPRLGVVRYEVNACAFRIQFDPATYAPSCHIGLNVGRKGRAVVIGSVYKDSSLVPWASGQTGA